MEKRHRFSNFFITNQNHFLFPRQLDHRSKSIRIRKWGWQVTFTSKRTKNISVFKYRTPRLVITVSKHTPCNKQASKTTKLWFSQTLLKFFFLPFAYRSVFSSLVEYCNQPSTENTIYFNQLTTERTRGNKTKQKQWSHVVQWWWLR